MGQENMHCLCYCQVGMEASPVVLCFEGSAPHYCWIEMEIPAPHYLPLIPPWLGDLGVPCYCSPNYLCWHSIVEMGGRWRVALLSLCDSESSASPSHSLWHHRSENREGCLVTVRWGCMWSSSLVTAWWEWKSQLSSWSPLTPIQRRCDASVQPGNGESQGAPLKLR